MNCLKQNIIVMDVGGRNLQSNGYLIALLRLLYFPLAEYSCLGVVLYTEAVSCVQYPAIFPLN